MKNTKIIKITFLLFSIFIFDAQSELHSQQKIDTTKVAGNSASAKFTNRAINVWKNLKRTKYVFNKEHVIDEKNGIYKYDCSGFIAEILLKEALPNHYNDIKNNMKNVKSIKGGNQNMYRPLVASFYDYFRNDVLESPKKISVSNKYWKVFTSIDSLQKGDLIVARYNDKWRKNNKNSTTGHMMIAWDIKKSDKKNQYIIQVLDAAASGHTKSEDTRYVNSVPVAEKRKGKNSGIGFGKMIFKVGNNERKRPYAYKWSLASKSWYNLVKGDKIYEKNGKRYDRLKGIVFARPIN